MPLEIQIQKSIGGQDTGAVTVRLTGSLDPATAPELERQLAPVLASPVKDLVFELAQLKFISNLTEILCSHGRLRAAPLRKLLAA